MDLNNIEKTHRFASGYYQGVQIVAEYMRNRSDLIETVIPKPHTRLRDESIKGLWFRAHAWMQSLETLNHSKHFQAVSAGNRALLEIAVDMVLLHKDATAATGEKFFQWGISERMKSAQQVVDFYAKKGLAVPDTHKDLEAYYINQGAAVDATRRTLWPDKNTPAKAVHPRRWTGRSDLSQDVEEVDHLYGAEITSEMGTGLLEYYRTTYRQMNWQIHSGVAGSWNILPEGFHIICGLAMMSCANLGMLCTKIILIDSGYHTAVEGLREEWENVRHSRNVAFVDTQNRFNESASQ